MSETISKTVDILNMPICLMLNASWLPLGIKTVKQAIKDMNGGDKGCEPPALALDLSFARNEDGTWDTSKIEVVTPTPWKDWVNLPIRDDFDLSIRSVNFTMRVPTVIICPNYNKMPIKKRRPTKESIRLRDGNICQYTGKKLTKNEGNIDHIIPVDQWRRQGLSGSPNTWENMVLSDKEVNTRKGNKSNQEAGLKLIRKPTAPKDVPMVNLLTTVRHPSWEPFLVKVEKRVSMEELDN